MNDGCAEYGINRDALPLAHYPDRRLNMPESDKFDHESIQDKQSIRAFFNVLIEGLEKGNIELSSEDDNVLLTPAELIHFSVKTKKKDGRSRMSIKLTWKDSQLEMYRGKSNVIHISS